MAFTFALDSRELDSRRAVTAYCSPANWPAEMSQHGPLLSVRPETRPAEQGVLVLCTDGQLIPALAKSLQVPIKTGQLPPLILAGAHSSASRQAEYEPGADDETFAAHLRFFLQELPAAVAERLNCSLTGLRTAVFGISHGGAFALAVAALHPTRFDAAIAFSATCREDARARLIPPPVSPATLEPTRYYLVAGTRERAVCRMNREVHRRLKQLNYSATFVTRPAGHESAFWITEFPRALSELYGTPNARRDGP